MFSAINRTKSKILTITLTAIPPLAVAAAKPNLPVQNTTEESGQPQGQTTLKSSATPPNQSSKQLIQTCTKLYQKYAIPLQQLWGKKAPELKAENLDGYQLIADTPPEACQDEATRKGFLELLARILNKHTGKIGVVLPMAGHPHLRHILNGFESFIQSNNLDPKKVLVVIDNQSRDDKTVHAIASLVFEHKVSAIIGGTKSGDAAILAKWGSTLRIPTFLLMEPQAAPLNPFVYYVHPTQKSLARAAVDANIRYGHRRVAILGPVDQHSEPFIGAYETAAKASGVEIASRVPYDGRRFESMEAAARKLFRLDSPERQSELQTLFETAKRRAKETGVPFNPKMVALQPDIRQDAILIADNFKIVRHFAKIMTYLGVRRMPLFGHFEWRSPGLISPWDGFLSGSYFVDFQGSYTSMPEPIRPPTPSSPFFVPSDKVEQADFSMVGWRAIEAPLRLSQLRQESRRKLDQKIPRKSGDGISSAFDANNVLVWEPFTFVVNAAGANMGQINMLNRVADK
jgi:ABC-type branched-subunit amino acid transport system substrate-binding protein